MTPLSSLYLSLPASAADCSTAKPNLMPFHLDYDGPAPVSTYFMPRVVPNPQYEQLKDDSDAQQASSESSVPKDIRIAAFRGRRIQAHELVLPQGFKGVVLSVPPRMTPQDIDVPTREANALGSLNSAQSASRASRSKPNIPLKADVQGEIQSEASSSNGLRRSPRKRSNRVTDDEERGYGSGRILRRKMEARKSVKISLDSESEDEDEPEPSPRPGVAKVQSDSKADELQEQTEEQTKHTKTSASTDIDNEASGANTKSTIESSGIASPPQFTAIVAIDVDDNAPSPSDRRTPERETGSSADETSMALPVASAPEDTLLAKAVTERTVTVRGTFDSFTIWSPDGPLDTERDEYVRGMGEWMNMCAIIHA